MARFDAAKSKIESELAFSAKYNYLIDLLNQGYSTEGLVDGNVMQVKINPIDLIAVYKGDDKLFGVDDEGRVFATSISNVENTGHYMTYGYGGSPGLECFYPLGGTGVATKFLGISPSVTSDIYFFDVNTKNRFLIFADGSFRMQDENENIRFILYADGGIELKDTNNVSVFGANGGASEEVWIACKNASNMQVGTNSTGAYYTHGSATKNYFNTMATSIAGIVGSKIGTSDSAGAGGSAKWLKLATITFEARYAYAAAVLKIIGSPSTAGAGYGATLYMTAIQQSAFPTAPVGLLYISDCVNMAVGNFVARVTYTAGDATVIEVWAGAVHDYKVATLFLVSDVGSADVVYTCGNWAASATAGTDLTVTQVD